jgi:hypothetical protein
MRVRGRNADISAPCEGFAGLPVDIAFLTGIGVPPSALAGVAVRASRLGVAPSREIVASGLVTQTMFYRALAGELGLAFHVGRLALHPGGSYGAILREGMAAVARSSGTRFRFALAPEGRALRRLLESGPRRRDDIVVMTPADFAASLRASNGSALARHVAGLDQAGLGRDSARTGSSRGQRLAAGAGVAIMAFCGTLAPFDTFFAIALLLCPIFLGLIYLRLAAVVEPLGIDLWKTHRWRVDDSRLPIYTVAVPVYREEAVLPQLIAALSALDYPLAKLDILLAPHRSR